MANVLNSSVSYSVSVVPPSPVFLYIDEEYTVKDYLRQTDNGLHKEQGEYKSGKDYMNVFQT